MASQPGESKTSFVDFNAVVEDVDGGGKRNASVKDAINANENATVVPLIIEILVSHEKKKNI